MMDAPLDGINKNDVDAITKKIDGIYFGKAMIETYELGYIRAIIDMEKGTVQEFKYQITYGYMGTPDKPISFESKDDAEAVARDLAKRNFINIKIKKVPK